MEIQKLFDKYNQITDPTSVQQMAANHLYSVWLNASAGTGKTKVLIDRIVRLLLEGNDISTILAITFTKAGAAEMKDRIMKVLQKWTLESDTIILQDLQKLYGTDFEKKSEADQKKYLHTAKSLFAKVLDSPYGLRIETIHAFCQFVLKKFPIESGVNPNFSIIDSREISVILMNSYKNLVTRKDDDFDISDALNILTKYKNENSLADVVQKIISNRKSFAKTFSNYSISLKNINHDLINILSEKYGVDNSIISTKNYDEMVDEYIKKSYEDIISFLPDLNILAKEILNISSDEKIAKSIKTPIKQSEKVIAFFNAYQKNNTLNIDDYVSLWSKNFASASLIKCIPSSENILEKLKISAGKIETDLLHLKHLEYGYAVTKFAFLIIKKYQQEKQKKSLLDYDDLIEKTLSLLTKSSDYSGWILYKLDKGINHILVDEAQDTSPEQWKIIDALSDGFFYTGTDEKSLKTIFVVGDRKQSIYSFQGANIDNFELYHKKFEQKIVTHGFEFKNLNLDTSFRTSFPVLSVVNEMLLSRKISAGITLESEAESDFIHRVAKKNISKPGIVELWPIVRDKSEKKDFNYWNKNRVVYESVTSKSILSGLIAKKIKSLITAENINAGDIMILLNRRTGSSILSPLVKKLTAEKIEIAGIDRLILTDNIIICDLIALAKISISEYDDLTLSSVLKSPFFNFDEDKVFDVCYNRKNKTVMEILSEKYPKIYEYLQLIKSKALSGLTPFEFFSFILNDKDNLKKCYHRAGIEISEIIQEFLSLCISFEQTSDHVLGLPGFVSWMSYDEVEIQRDIEKTSGKLRIMTVHGAKGLQSKIVFLPDTMSNFNTSTNDMKILFNESDKQDFVPYIKPPYVDEIENYSTVKNDFNRRQMEEKKRLLYVAMTRAEEALYVCGYADKNTSKKENFEMSDEAKNFYEMILNSFDSLQENGYELEKLSDEIFDGIEIIKSCLNINQNKKNIIRVSKINDKTRSFFSIDTEKIPDENINTFNINFDNLFSEKKKININIKNTMHNESKKSIYSFDIQNNNFAILYGSLMHKILEMIPNSYQNSDEKNLISLIEKILSTANFLNDSQKKNFIEKITFALKNENIKNIITSKNSSNEITIASRENSQYRIDKLIVDNEKKSILIVDYKTDSNAEKTSQENLQKYQMQLKNYKKIISNIYKDYEVKTAILWTSNFSISMLD